MEQLREAMQRVLRYAPHRVSDALSTERVSRAGSGAAVRRQLVLGHVTWVGSGATPADALNHLRFKLQVASGFHRAHCHPLATSA